MTYKEAYESARARLSDAGIRDAECDAFYLLEHVTGITRSGYFLDPGKSLTVMQERRFLELVRSRESHMPLQRLTGTQAFMGLDFLVNDDTLVPRQDTEVLAETVIKHLRPGIDILDMCTGSGCILISILKLGGLKLSALKPGDVKSDSLESHGLKPDSLESAGLKSGSLRSGSPENRANLRGTGADISEGALKAAGENAVRHGVSAGFVRSDLFSNVEGSFDIIVSNPPYIPAGVIKTLDPEVRFHEPRIALDGGPDGLSFYRRIISGGKEHLRENGMLFFETGYDQASRVSELMEEAGFTSIKAVKDLAGLDRVIYGVKRHVTGSRT